MVLNKLKNKAGKAFSPRVNPEQYLVALDVGTENVKALIGRINNDKIQVVGVGRAHQNLGDMQAGAVADISGVIQNCNTALAIAEEQAQMSLEMLAGGDPFAQGG